MTSKSVILLSSGLPPDDLLWSKIHEGKLGPLVYAHGLRFQDREPSLEWRRKFRQDYIRSLISHQEYRSQTAQFLEAAAARDLPVMILRGTRIAENLYDDPALRMYTDIDALIPKDRLPDAKQLARDLGFFPPFDRDDGFFERHHYHLCYTSRTSGIPLEIHWALSPPFSLERIDYADLFSRARKIEVAGVPSLAPAVEDDLVLLAAHLTRHSSAMRPLPGPELTTVCLEESLLAWMMDLDRFVERYPQLDWDTVVNRAQSWEISGPVVMALDAVAQVLGTPVPRPPRRELERFAHSRALESLVGRAVRGTNPLSRGFRAVHRAALGSTGALCLYSDLARLVFPPSSWLRKHAPLAGAPLALRWVAHAVRSAGQIARLGTSLLFRAFSRVLVRHRHDRLPVAETQRSAAQG